MNRVVESCELFTFLIENYKYSKKEIKSLLTHGSVLVDDKVVTKYNHLLKKAK
jgi:16S rRNA U516 pseudouridylate synthase RsuA-like enzyme